MEINLARTFLEIVNAGSFLRAAERLHVTQTAVSARVRSLEQSLGRRLFTRSKAGAALTPAGEQFLRYASALVQVWERARAQVALPRGRRAVVTVGCEMSLWDPLMVDWMLWMRDAAPQLALRVEVGAPDVLLDRVSEGLLDIAVVYAPRQRPGVKIELLIEEKLVLVTTSPRARSRRSPRSADYVFVDWSPEFSAQHKLAFPELAGAGPVIGLGPLAREYLLEAGGSGYFRFNVIRRHLESGRLHLVRGAPEFVYPAYAVSAANADPKVLTPALAGLRQAAQPAPPAKPVIEPRASPRGR